MTLSAREKSHPDDSFRLGKCIRMFVPPGNSHPDDRLVPPGNSHPDDSFRLGKVVRMTRSAREKSSGGPWPTGKSHPDDSCRPGTFIRMTLSSWEKSSG